MCVSGLEAGREVWAPAEYYSFDFDLDFGFHCAESVRRSRDQLEMLRHRCGLSENEMR